jgi:hypothetical protein
VGNKTICRTGLLTLVLAVMLLLGCGSESGIEGDDSIGVELTAHDDGTTTGSGTTTIDVVRSDCEAGDDDDGENIDPESSDEPYYDTLGKARFTYYNNDQAPTIAYIINGYTVEYIPLQSPDGQGGFFTSPNLVNLDQQVLNQIILTPQSNNAERAFILIPIGTKIEYVNKVTAQRKPIQGLYSVRVTFFGRIRTGGDFTLTSTLSLSFGNYDTCGEN